MNSEDFNKPSWDTAPKNANWLAMDSDGTWFWYEEEPLILDDCTWNYHHNDIRFWDSNHYASPALTQGELDNFWKNSLEERPHGA